MVTRRGGGPLIRFVLEEASVAAFKTGVQMRDRLHVIERAVMAALMHHRPDYRNANTLDASASVLARFVEAELEATEQMRSAGNSDKD
jgi:hypothetical protein